MKCLVIHGSPRRGNTWDVLKLTEEEMNKKGEFEFEEIELVKEKIPNCLGCFNCIIKDESLCPHKDIIQKIVSKIEEADAVIITSPVYSMQITGLLKNFIDHMSYNFHRPRFFYKKALIITTTAGAGHKESANYLKEVMYYWDVNYVLTMPIAYRGAELSDKNKDIIIRKADEFAVELNSGKIHEPSLKSILMYNIWKGMSIEGRGVGIADCKYWSDEKLKGTNFYPGIPVGFIKRIFGKLIFSRFDKK